MAAIIAINILWASGGGATNLIVERLGGIVFAEQSGISGDAAVAWFFFVSGLGLFIGIMIARRVGTYFHLTGRTVGFIGWSLIVQGVLFSLIGFVPNLWFGCFLLLLSRLLLGAEFTVQETLLMRLVPDRLRGRIGTTDRAGGVSDLELLNRSRRLVFEFHNAQNFNCDLRFAFRHIGTRMVDSVCQPPGEITEEGDGRGEGGSDHRICMIE